MTATLGLGLIGITDVDDLGAIGESVLLEADLVTAGTDPWLAFKDSAPNPAPAHGAAVYDPGTNSYLFSGPDASNDAIAYVTARDLTSLTLTVTQGTGGSSIGIKLAAPTVPDRDDDGIPDETDACPDSDLSPKVVLRGCDSGVTNQLLADGCTIKDVLDEATASASNDRQYYRAVRRTTRDLTRAGIIIGAERDAIRNCAR